jgi:hypothetical protein
LTVISITLYISPSQQEQQQAMAQQTNTTVAPPQVNATTTTPGNFLTYDNATLGVKIQYPSNWEKFEQQNNTVLFISPFQSDLDRYITI